MVPDHVARAGGGKLTRYATTEEDEATLRELLLRYVSHSSDIETIAYRLLNWLNYAFMRNVPQCIFLSTFHLGLASQISCIADIMMR